MDEVDFELCCACGARADFRHEPAEGVRTYVCAECVKDGSYLKWLTEQIEGYVASKGWTCEIDPKTGRKLWTPPNLDEA